MKILCLKRIAFSWKQSKFHLRKSLFELRGYLQKKDTTNIDEANAF